MADELLAAAAATRDRETALLLKHDEVRDLKELAELQTRRRGEFEKALQMKKYDMRQWMRYARFEVTQRELARARSIFERALQVTSEWVPLWLRYVEMELAEENVSRARNLLERATHRLPRVKRLWLVYIGLEERLGEIDKARDIFRHWLELTPDEDVWDVYIEFTRRHFAVEQQSEAAAQFVAAFPNSVASWKALANPSVFGIDHCRQVFTQAIDASQLSDVKNELLIDWARVESAEKEFDRARALLTLTSGPAAAVELQRLEKLEIINAGDMQSMGQSLDELTALKAAYNRRIASNPQDYDTWWALISLQESREVYERALACAPVIDSPSTTTPKTKEWRKYAWLWLRYSIFMENQTDTAGALSQAAEILDRAISINSRFAKLWKARAELAIRQGGGLESYRKIMGRALAMSDFKPKVIKLYLEFEKKTSSTERVRKLYQVYCERWPQNPHAWISFAEFEAELGELQRVRSIYKIATSEIKDSEELWHLRCETEADSGDFVYSRLVYELWEKSTAGGARPYIEHAMFEVSTGLSEDDNDDDNNVDTAALERARCVFSKGHERLSTADRLVLYDAETQFEEIYGDSASIDSLKSRAPVSRLSEDGNYEFVFNDSDMKAETSVAKSAHKSPAVLKLLANAQNWAESNKR